MLYKQPLFSVNRRFMHLRLARTWLPWMMMEMNDGEQLQIENNPGDGPMRSLYTWRAHVLGKIYSKNQ